MATPSSGRRSSNGDITTAASESSVACKTPKNTTNNKNSGKNKTILHSKTPSTGNATSSCKTPTTTPDVKTDVPVWERLYKAETTLTASMKKGAQSGECQDKIFSFSGSKSKRAHDANESQLLDRRQDNIRTSPTTTTPKNNTPSLRSTVRSNRKSSGSPTTTTPVHERLYQSETYSSTKQKEQPKTVTPPKSLYRKKKTTTPPSAGAEPAYLRLSRMGTETLRKTNAN